MIGPDGMSITPISGAIGARVDGIHLQAPLDDAAVSALRDALLRHCVLFFRDQDLTDAEQVAFAENFAPVNTSAFAKPGATGIDAQVEWLEDGPDSPPKADLWHTDVAFKPEPPDYAILNCREAPPAGGDTLWLNLYWVYQQLSPVMQQLVDGLELDCRPVTAAVVQRGPNQRFVEYRPDPGRPGCTQPLVRVHPGTKEKALYMCGQYMHSVVGMAEDESDALIRFLRSRLDDPNGQCRWHWKANDLVIWDERCTNHRATSDHYPQYRLMRRCTAGTARPMGANSLQ